MGIVAPRVVRLLRENQVEAEECGRITADARNARHTRADPHLVISAEDKTLDLYGLNSIQIMSR